LTKIRQPYFGKLVARAFHQICQAASRKAPGHDVAPAELFKAGGETVSKQVSKIIYTRRS